MTEKKVLQQQETNGQKAFYLIAVGMFYHAYGCGAFALNRAIGYRVLRKHRKHGDILICGFPASQLDTVLQRICEAGGEVLTGTLAGENKITIAAGATVTLQDVNINGSGAGLNNATCGTVTIGGTIYYDGSAYQNGGDTYLTTSPLVYQP